MSFESATQRLTELRALSGQPMLPAATGSSTGPAVAAMTVEGAAFSEVLGQAQTQIQFGMPGAPANSIASGLPVLQVGGIGAYPGGTPSMGSVYGSVGAGAGAYGAPATIPGWNGGLAPVQGAGMPGMYPQGGVGQRMVALAQQELGVRESPMGSNDSPRIRQYREASGAEATPGPWCAYFVSHLAKQSGAPVGTNGAGTGWVPALEQWGKAEGRFLPSGQQPQPGDIVIFDRNGDGLSDHTGIVESVGADGTLNTIEGNTSDMVARRTYASSSGQVRGFVRPG